MKINTHTYFNSSHIIAIFKLCIVTLNTWRTEKKAHLICEHFRGKKTEGLFFTKVCILIHAYSVKFKCLQTANSEVLHMQCKHLNSQKYQKWQEELQGRTYVMKLKWFMYCWKNVVCAKHVLWMEKQRLTSPQHCNKVWLPAGRRV